MAVEEPSGGGEEEGGQEPGGQGKAGHQTLKVVASGTRPGRGRMGWRWPSLTYSYNGAVYLQGDGGN